jgi:hypothetical protein
LGGNTDANAISTDTMNRRDGKDSFLYRATFLMYGFE